jgi:predicted membrane protein (TIGR00267 family)
MPELSRRKVVETARKNIEEGEKWHSRVNVREIVFGFNDGTVSTLALLAGVTGAAAGRIGILIAGLSGVIAGAISMAVGAYISSKSEIEHNRSEIEREKAEVEKVPEIEKEEMRQLYQKKARFTEKELDMIITRITDDKKTWVDLMMKEELGLFQERFANPVKVGLIMMTAFLIGGLAPLTPYFITPTPELGLILACGVTFTALFIIGVWKTRFTKRNWASSGIEMVVIGVIASAVPYIIGDILISQIIGGML